MAKNLFAPHDRVAPPSPNGYFSRKNTIVQRGLLKRKSNVSKNLCIMHIYKDGLVDLFHA